jgi:hypothetical protein
MSPYSSRYVRRPASTRCSASEQPRRRSKQIAGARRDEKDRLAAAGADVARHRALRTGVDDLGGHPAQVRDAAADSAVEIGE